MVNQSETTKTCSVSTVGLNGGDAEKGQQSLMAPCLVEFIGTFFLTYVIGHTAGWEGGLTLAVMIYAGGHVSGGHFNPAVTVSFLMRGGSFPTGQASGMSAIFYIIAQYAGASLAAILSVFIKSLKGAFKPAYLEANMKNSDLYVGGFVNEILFGFLLCYMVLHCATARDNEGNDFYGLAIGGVAAVAVNALANPAVAIALVWSLFKKSAHTDAATGNSLYNFAKCLPALLGPYAGGVLAAIVFGMTSPNDC